MSSYMYLYEVEGTDSNDEGPNHAFVVAVSLEHAMRIFNKKYTGGITAVSLFDEEPVLLDL